MNQVSVHNHLLDLLLVLLRRTTPETPTRVRRRHRQQFRRQRQQLLYHKLLHLSPKQKQKEKLLRNRSFSEKKIASATFSKNNGRNWKLPKKILISSKPLAASTPTAKKELESSSASTKTICSTLQELQQTIQT